MDERAIGVFDSGLGGLTAVKELRKILPNEDIVYFGDTSRVPYGTRSKETIIQYAKQDIDFLLSKNVKLVIAACGTASTVLLPPLTDHFDFLYSGVVGPTVKAAVQATKTGHIGILATPSAIKTRAYEKAIHEMNAQLNVFAKACPMFVPLVENGYTDPDDPVAKLIAAEYLSAFRGTDIDTIILGCTHYPILKRIIAQFVNDDVRLIDSGKETARYAYQLLEAKRMLGGKNVDGTYQFYVSDSAESFAAQANLFLGSDLHLKAKKVNIQDN